MTTEPSILKQKIDYLHRTADKILDPNTDYSWGCTRLCNCGWLAQTILGLQGEIDHNYMFYGSYTENLCSQTGLPMPFLIQVLLDAGFTKEEIIEIEGEDYQKVFSCVNKKEAKANAAKHLRSIANRLETKLTVMGSHTTKTNTPVTVSIGSNMIKSELLNRIFGTIDYVNDAFDQGSIADLRNGVKLLNKLKVHYLEASDRGSN